MRLGRRVALGSLALIPFAGFAAVALAGRRLSAPAPSVVGVPPADLPVADVRIASPSGADLHGWWLAGRPGGGAVVLMHGIRANRRAMVRRARVLHQHGFSVLLFDFGAEGESPGGRITFGHLESLDAAAAVAFARQRLPDEKIGALGVSLGGAAALLGPAPLRVDALVLESVYPDIGSALSNRLRIGLGGVAGPLLAPVLTGLFEALLPPVLGYRPRDLRPIERIGAVTAPVLVTSGSRDARTPIAEARALFARAPEPRQFREVAGAAHVDLERHDSEGYWAVTLPFLTRYLQGGQA